MNNFNFVTDGSIEYRLAGNDWFAVSQDDETVLLVDTDCALPRTDGTLVGLESRWSDCDWDSVDGENGQALLDYTNSLADKYLRKIKYAIKPVDISVDCIRCFNAPTILKGDVHNAYMFPLSYDELSACPDIAGKIYQNSRKAWDKLKNESGDNLSCGSVWTRTFSGIVGDYRCAWYLGSTSGDLYNNSNVSNVCRVASAFNLKKSSIIRIAEDGEIILKPEDVSCNDSMAESYNKMIDFVQSIVNVHDTEIKLHGYSDISEDKVQFCRDILKLATGTVTEK